MLYTNHEKFSVKENDFLNKIGKILEENLSNERFGVSELARETGMSRSNLLRKIKKLTNLSVSQFIRQVRLQHAMEMLRKTSLTVSEVSYKTGFGSTSYFIKCFREYYGYPPGKVGKRELNESDFHQNRQSKKKRTLLLSGTTIIVLFAALLFILFNPLSSKSKNLEKSIAVLPFINDSNDSTNVYIINGIMESILNDLQKIEDLRVISRMSVERYRNHPKNIQEIARELNVNYIVEGSGQKMGEQILFNVQLIEAPTDKHLWAEQYNREARDIFNLQREIAKNIADKIEVIITPDEEKMMNKVPTHNLVAYDYFLKGLDLLYRTDRESLGKAIPYFKKAIELDKEFARAYAAIAMAYFFLNENQTEKRYSDSINYYADKAIFFDAALPQSLIAKGLFYMNAGEYKLAVSYFEKALEYNPNYDLALAFLVELYVNYLPDTEKYLEYALKGIKLNIAGYDSLTASIIFLHISNAFIQSGFVDEAERYINQSLEYNPKNLYSEYVKAYIQYAKNRDLLQLKEHLIQALNKDSTRLDIMQEIGKICYYLRDYESAYHYYKRFTDSKESLNLNIYRSENAKIGFVFAKMGRVKEAEKYFMDFKDYAENDKSIYKYLSLAVFYAYKGDTKRAVDQLRLFSQQNNYHYWIIIFLKMDPLIDNIKDLPEFRKVYNGIETKFRNYHKQIKANLRREGLL